MKGSDLVDVLLKELDCKNDNQLAQRLGVAAPNIYAWRNRGQVTKTIFRNALRRVSTRAVQTSIKPIAEFRKLDLFHGKNIDTLTKRIGLKPLIERLKTQKGIYLFYDSSGEVIYCGRTTKKNLLSEMTQAYEQPRAQYKRKFTNGQNKFATQTMAIRDTALYFSAYQVDDFLISNLEAFVTRVVPNNLINKKTERLSLA
jgi:hypothetical protein